MLIVVNLFYLRYYDTLETQKITNKLTKHTKTQKKIGEIYGW